MTTHEALLDLLQNNDFVQLPGDWQVFVQESRSEPTKLHYIMVNKREGLALCSCDGFRYNDRCFHIDEITAASSAGKAPT